MKPEPSEENLRWNQLNEMKWNEEKYPQQSKHENNINETVEDSVTKIPFNGNENQLAQEREALPPTSNQKETLELRREKLTSVFKRNAREFWNYLYLLQMLPPFLRQLKRMLVI